MATRSHHAEWLSLVEVSGPFLTMPVLEKVFPQGLPAHDPTHFSNLRLALEEWEENLKSRRPNPALHREWIKYVLRQTLEYPDEVLAEGQAIPETIKATIPEHGETLRPDFLIRNPEDISPSGKARLLIQVYPPEQNLDKPVDGKRWKASPATRMMELLHSAEVPLGLITNGEHWMMVYAPRGETTGYASWYASLWTEEKVTLQAFRALLGVHRFFSVPDDETLEAMLAESAKHQQEVTDQLGYQVRRAVEVLIQSLDAADRDNDRRLLADISEAELYESALTVMMRLVFLFCAEERELLLLGDPLYDQHYAVSTLVSQLQEAADQHGEEVLERRGDAWVRLLSTFRAVYGGIDHDRMKLMPYGGRLFDPDRFPFLEGRRPKTKWRETPANPIPVNNRTVLHLLRSLQYLEMGGESRRLSFRALDIEQIGHVYEGLLDHTAKRAAEPILGLIGQRGDEPEIPLSILEGHLAKGEDALLKFLKEQTGKAEKTLRRALDAELETDELDRIRAACGNERELFKRIEPFAGLICGDSFDRPVVIRKGSFYVTAGTDRRSSGTHYTPRNLTEPIVQYTLEPLVYEGPAEGWPKEEWKLRSPRELLDLKICDMACGSGAFLVQACRYMSERLLEAWEDVQKSLQGAPGITPHGEPSAGKPNELLIPNDINERQTYAMRLIAQRSLYGVDKNPLAIEMAKLSLWLLTLSKSKPFEFIDHSLRCGDSLVGLHSIDQLRHYSLKPDADDAVLFKGPLDSAVDEAINLRLKLEDMPANSVDDVQRQEKLLIEANEKNARLRCAADLLVAAEFWGEGAKDKLERVRYAAVKSGHYVEKGPTEEFEQVATKERRGQLMFHWPLEFPEVIVKRGGFDALLGNPPFLGGTRISELHGDEYNSWLWHLNVDASRKVDIVAHFFCRAFSLLIPKAGSLGYVATNSISQGDTRNASLTPIIESGGVIFRAITSFRWPGTAELEASIVHVFHGSWLGSFILNGKSVSHIGAFLSDISESVTPQALMSNQGRCLLGSCSLGEGFIVENEEVEAIIREDENNKDVVKPYLIGRDLNNSLDLGPTRHTIYFEERTAEQAARFRVPWKIVTEKVYPERITKDRSKYRRMVEEWWKFWHARGDLYSQLGSLERAFARSRVSDHHMVGAVDPSWVFSEQVVVFCYHDWATFAALQSCFHEHWTRRYASTLKTDVRYIPTACHDSFPLPDSNNDQLAAVGERYHKFRGELLLSTRRGMTKTYNRFHNPDESSADIQKLRDLHVEMDQSVAAAYGWTDLDLGHGFHETKQGVRFTISEPARREVLQRLLKLNHERYAEEVKQGLHGKKGAAKKAAPKKKAPSNTTKEGVTLFDLGKDDE